jgi:hypothetical protein
MHAAQLLLLLPWHMGMHGSLQTKALGSIYITIASCIRTSLQNRFDG